MGVWRFNYTLENVATGNIGHYTTDVYAEGYFKAWQSALSEALREMSRRGVTWIVKSLEDDNEITREIEEVEA